MMIEVAQSAGFCFGVDRAVSELYKLIDSGEKRQICTVGPIIHNPTIIKDLESKGVRAYRREELPDGCFAVIRTHGVTADTADYLASRGIEFADYTCPFVKKIQQIAAEKTDPETVFLIAGDLAHPEVEGIVSYAKGPFHAFKTLDELKKLVDGKPELLQKKAVMAAQTTFDVKEWRKITEFSKNIFIFLTIYDTICFTTEKRQREAERLAAECDAVIVIGGKGSSNTAALCETAKRLCPETYLVENIGDLPKNILKKAKKVGVTAGASTPRGIIREVVEEMSALNEENFNDVSFEEGVLATLKPVANGDRVNATVIAVAPGELQLDIGTKHTGYMTASEYSALPVGDLTKVVKVGDEMEVQVVRVNDVEGTVALSRKRVEYDNFKRELDEAEKSGAVLQGKVTEIINTAGVIVNYKGQTVFVPAAHTGIPKDGDLSVLDGKEVNFKVIGIRFERHRRKVVGSIKFAERDTRTEKLDKIFSEIEVGKEYVGKVKSLTSFGAFVDIGGVDGLVHISELSWRKIHHPSEVVSVGDEIKVYVKDFNTETHKISLGYRRPEDNMFLKFAAEHQVGDVIEVKIVKLMSYAAFAEIIPGVDGYIHISQIADCRVEKISDYLKVGDVVKAKIIDINNEKFRATLSIRALIEKKPDDEPAAETAPAEDAPAAEPAPAEEAPAAEAPAEAPAAETPAAE